MRSFQWPTMIGSLLSFVLFPLSRYLSRRPPGLPPAAWDGHYTRWQTTRLDRSRATGGGAKGETKERMMEPSPDKLGNEGSNVDGEQPVPGLGEGTNKEAVTGGSAATERAQQPDDSLEDGEVTTRRSAADGDVSPAASQSSEQAPTARLQCLHTEDGAQEDTGRQPPHTHSAEVPPPVPATQVTECWDAYEGPTAEDAELPHPSPSFEAGGPDAGFPGLAEDTWCSPWRLPAGSYYPPVEQILPLEVTWREWEDVDGSAAQGECTMTFTVMSYNILAQDLLEANEDLYRHSPSKVLDWSFRRTLLVKEIQKWAPDILCLQEVQENHYSEHLHPALSQMGYTCVYKRRTGTKTDGCATCYRSRCFSAVSLARLEFFKPETELLDRHNVGIVVLLQPAAPRGPAVAEEGPVLCVANTHLLFNPRRGDVKLAQLAVMLAEIDRTVKSCKVKGRRCDVILCGDFNAVPHMPLYQLITSGQLCYRGLPAWMVSGQEDLSHRSHSHRLFAPLWPSSLRITDNCQYVSVNDMFDGQNQESGKRHYSHDFLLQLRYSPAACVRPQDLTLIPGVTDNTPDASGDNQASDRSHVISHRLDLESVYQHTLPGSGSSEVTTLNSDAGATVDYIFYSPRRVVSEPRAGGDFASGGLTLTGRLSLLSEDVLWGMSGLPNDTFPSDHLSLLARFQLNTV